MSAYRTPFRPATSTHLDRRSRQRPLQVVAGVDADEWWRAADPERPPENGAAEWRRASRALAARARPLPYERRFVPFGYPVVPERGLGVCCTNGLVSLLAGLDVVDHDDGLAITAVWRP